LLCFFEGLFCKKVPQTLQKTLEEIFLDLNVWYSAEKSLSKFDLSVWATPFYRRAGDKTFALPNL